MFNDWETRSLLKSVMEERMTVLSCSDVVMAALMAKHDFGSEFFHKILSKSVLKPGSVPAKERVG